MSKNKFVKFDPKKGTNGMGSPVEGVDTYITPTPKVEPPKDKTSEIADKLVEWRYQLRIEHNHGDMKWYAYFAGKEGRRLFDKDIDWETAGDTPLEAITALNDLVSKNPEARYDRF